MKMLDRMKRMIYNLTTMKQDKKKWDTGFCIVMQSRRAPNVWWTFTFSPYNLKDNRINASVWWSESTHAVMGMVSLKSVYTKYMSGLWEVKMVSKLYLTLNTIPYDYIPAFHPGEVVKEMGHSEDTHEFVGMTMYNANKPNQQTLSFVRLSPRQVKAISSLRCFFHCLPFKRHTQKMRQICLDLTTLPPSPPVFLGGIHFQSSSDSFVTLADAQQKFTDAV